ncbi:DNA mismatch repair endonuclease MutH [Pseudidiomarina sp. 1APP75-32.1]|uniref:DNA mismatch repair protein MutH n=1 Tax=Pseudidiomarina terrestris TaxID=2820060 RepID=A0AAW7QVY6_9GAMM|nr:MULTISPECIES: DNA mismatch repair endonuclease MutH [unclassified Pseudidiomarina]MDN7124400.1 DNA mismatch repair endonuclease MutH [Pseudidiomarina sp. 1APP75-32.1]MDN7129309.1 DNA mismatch repair endonuclease MutH [Pseudidiomarina sp. 1APR75-15]MDN7136886.1 DNA mismatch repair endonuclease MutH [Pseudidiomarina sp. 1ASP75-14]MEA3587780.1 DNA mismatch repair endonuclease MutH [Pseudidiomarina sp. 1APP75-27a]
MSDLRTLFDAASALAGQSFAELAAAQGMQVPADLRRHKGWVGQLLEAALGASAGSQALQDFPELGVELKTIPLDARGRPLETTFVCTTPLTNVAGVNWEASNVRNKLQCVLWIPIDGRRSVALAERTVGTAFLWQPSEKQETQLKRDWQEHMDRIAMGEVEQITAHQGEVLQLRPKAANSRVLTEAIGPSGQLIQTLPRGFYLKTQFTWQIIRDTFGLDDS